MPLDFTETMTIEVPAVEEQMSAFQEQEYKKDHGLIVEISAIHEGMTSNFNYYNENTLQKSLKTWVDPYPRPILLNHDPRSEPVGRVMASRIEYEADGTPFVKLQVAITDPEAISKVLDQRYLTGSVGGSATQANCSICGADWAEASIGNIPCKHRRGKTYKGKLAYMEMNGIKWKEYSFVNMPADEKSGIRSLSVAANGQDEEMDDWVRSARFFALNMDDEEILEFSESEDRDVLEGMNKKESTPLYMQLKGAFLSALAVAESEMGLDEVVKDGPYGKVDYADPGYREDDKPRYPIDTKDHVRAAWSYINQKKNANKYTADQLRKIKSRIKRAAKKFGIDIEDNNKESDVSTKLINEEEEDILAVAEGLSSDLASTDDAAEEEEEAASAEEEEASDQETEVEEEEEVEESTSEEDEESAQTTEEDEDVVDDETVSEDSEDEEISEGKAPEGQERDREEDIDPDTSDGAPVSREEDEVADGEEIEEEETADGDEVAETDLDEEVKALESRVEALEAREQALLDENAKLKTALKRTLAERVVDIKIALGVAESEDRKEMVEDHLERSAASLADSMRDLAEMSQTAPVGLPEAFEQDALAVNDDDDEPVVTEGEEDVTESAEDDEDEIDPEDVFVDALMGRRRL